MNNLHKLPSVIMASGTLGFFGEGYKYHNLIWPFVWIAKKSTFFVAKTVTSEELVGNMPLKKDSSPVQMKPDCIFIDFTRWLRGGMLNAVGLSNYGLEYYLKQGRWQKRTKPFAISIMLIGKTHEKRVEEARKIVDLFLRYAGEFIVNPIIKLNISCPNVKKHMVCDSINLVGQQKEILDILSVLGWKIIIKVNVNADIQQVKEISDHEACYGICVSNTIHWDELPDWIKWRVYPEFKESPLAKYGGGGHSGKDLLPIIIAWIARARQAGISKPIIGGGGIFTPFGVWKMFRAGASAISIGTPLLFRPWMVPINIILAHMLFRNKYF